jgi:hypothetical protein
MNSLLRPGPRCVGSDAGYAILDRGGAEQPIGEGQAVAVDDLDPAGIGIKRYVALGGGDDDLFRRLDIGVEGGSTRRCGPDQAARRFGLGSEFNQISGGCDPAGPERRAAQHHRQRAGGGHPAAHRVHRRRGAPRPGGSGQG